MTVPLLSTNCLSCTLSASFRIFPFACSGAAGRLRPGFSLKSVELICVPLPFFKFNWFKPLFVTNPRPPVLLVGVFSVIAGFYIAQPLYNRILTLAGE